MKKVLSVILALMMLFSLVACGADEPAGDVTADTGNEYDEYNLTVATVYTANEACVQGTQKFIDLLTERSGGKITGQLFTDGSMGNEGEIASQVAAGSCDVTMGGTAGIDLFTPENNYWTAPYLFSSWEHISNVLESDLGAQLNAAMEEDGIKLLAYCNRGWRNTTTNIMFNTPEDMGNMKLRLPSNHTLLTVFEGIGANCVSIALNELYAALQTGTCDASEGPYSQICSNKFYEVQKYMVLTEHVPDVSWIMINNDLFNSFNEATQQLILECAKEGMEYASVLTSENEEAYLKECTDGGMEIVEIDRTPFVEAAAESLKQMFEEDFAVSYEDVMALK